MIIESTGEIEYLPISLWFEDDNHYHAFVDAPDANVRNTTQMNHAHTEELDDDDFGMPNLPAPSSKVNPISMEIASRPISREPVKEGKVDKRLSEELKEDILIAGDDLADFAFK
jgi:hypothetical protein